VVLVAASAGGCVAMEQSFLSPCDARRKPDKARIFALYYRCKTRQFNPMTGGLSVYAR
jgi:hypothetical protein